MVGGVAFGSWVDVARCKYDVFDYFRLYCFCVHQNEEVVQTGKARYALIGRLYVLSLEA